MKKLDKQAEDRLLGAIEKTATLVNDGLDPNEAIAKAAQSDGIPPGHISLMVHAYNTGRTTRQRQEGADPFEKAATFPLADTAAVLQHLYPDKVKTAAEQHSETVVSLEYAVPPTGMLERRARRSMRKQGANINWRQWADGENVVAPEPYPEDPKQAMKRAYCDADRLQREIAEARRKQAAAMDKMAETFSSITEYFRSPASTPIPVVKEQAFLMHGAKGRQLIDEIVKVTPGLMKIGQHKQAARREVSNYRLERADGEVYGLVSEFLDNLDEYKQCKQAHAELLKSNSERAEALLRPFAVGPKSVLDEMGYSTVSKQAAAGMSALLGISAIKNLMTGGGENAGKAEAGQALSSLTDPAHEAKLRNIRAQAMMQDLLANDPVISGYQPQESIDAYNEIVGMSPRAADQKLVMQSLLRKRLEQGSLDPFEVDQLLGMEEKQKKINMPVSTGKGGGDGSVLA